MDTIKTVSANMQHKCEICEKVFKAQNKLKNHFSTVHDDRGKKITCNICTKTFHIQRILNIHIKTDHGGRKLRKDYKCESCGKSLSTAQNLKKHIHILHEAGHKNHKCESCGNSFFQAGDLKRHILTVHEGHKDYKCESCGKSFSHSGDLNVTLVVNHFLKLGI